MTGFLLDTNVVSETTKDYPTPSVIHFLSQQTDLWLSSLVVHELEFGLQLAPHGRRRERLVVSISRFLADYTDRILSVDRESAEWSARFRAAAIRSGRSPDLIDLLIAGTAWTRGLVIVTRNVRDFTGLGIEIVNPWEAI